MTPNGAPTRLNPTRSVRRTLLVTGLATATLVTGCSSRTSGHGLPFGGSPGSATGSSGTSSTGPATPGGTGQSTGAGAPSTATGTGPAPLSSTFGDCSTLPATAMTTHFSSTLPPTAFKEPVIGSILSSMTSPMKGAARTVLAGSGTGTVTYSDSSSSENLWACWSGVNAVLADFAIAAIGGQYTVEPPNPKASAAFKDHIRFFDQNQSGYPQGVTTALGDGLSLSEIAADSKNPTVGLTHTGTLFLTWIPSGAAH